MDRKKDMEKKKDKEKMKPIVHQGDIEGKGKDFVPRELLESFLWDVRRNYRCIDLRSKAQKRFVDSQIDGFVDWDVVYIEGCGLKWISREAKKYLVDAHGVDPKLLVENFNIARTFDLYYEEDLELRNCLSNNKAGFRKALVREHVVPIGEVKRMVADWSVPMRKIVEDGFDLALIAAEEDARLTKAGFRRKRPGGWRACYEECGIEVERLPRGYL